MWQGKACSKDEWIGRRRRKICRAWLSIVKNCRRKAKLINWPRKPPSSVVDNSSIDIQDEEEEAFSKEGEEEGGEGERQASFLHIFCHLTARARRHESLSKTCFEESLNNKQFDFWNEFLPALWTFHSVLGVWTNVVTFSSELILHLWFPAHLRRSHMKEENRPKKNLRRNSIGLKAGGRELREAKSS